MQRVLVVGISGSGKSWLATRLGEVLGLPTVHLDSIFWNDNWTEAPSDVVETEIQAALDKDRWVMEGYIEPLGSDRVRRAEQVVYIDCSGLQAAMGVVQRWLRHRRVARPEMPPGNTDALSWSFIRMVLQRGERPEIEAALRDTRTTKVVRLRSRRDVRAFVRRAGGSSE